MSRKAVYIQTLTDSGGVSVIKPHNWCSMTWDNVKMSIDAYKDGIEPREDCKIEITDGKDVYQLTVEQLLEALRYFIEYSASGKSVVHYPNRFHYILPDAVKKPAKGSKMSNY